MIQLLNANALQIPFAAGSVQCVVTSPPYWGLRDYNVSGQLGLEQTPAEYVAHLVAVFAEVWRILRDDGTLWLNIGDSYTGGNGNGGVGPKSAKQVTNKGSYYGPVSKDATPARYGAGREHPAVDGLRPKNLTGIPWRVAFALQDAGWYLRSDIIWSKPNPMPESVTDRPTRAHEYIFLLTKQARYYYNAAAIKEKSVGAKNRDGFRGGDGQAYVHDSAFENSGTRVRKQRKPAGWDTRQGAHGAFHREGRAQDIEYTTTHAENRNKRTVWEVATYPYSGAHFATFPPALVEPMIKAGSRPGDIVFDPFVGSGTTLQVARALGRSGVGLDLSYTYLHDCARARLSLTALSEWENGPAPVVDNLPLFEGMTL